MNAAADNAGVLLEQAQDRSIQGRRHLTAVTRDLFAPARSVLSERAHALMSGILGKLAGQLEASLRLLLEEHLSRDPAAAPDSLAALAEDEAGAARRILFESGLLVDPELVEAAWNRAREHLLASALRSSPGANPPDQAGGGAVQDLLNHQNGEIAESTKTYLVEEARRVDSYQEPLLRRRDLAPGLALRLATHVAAALRAYLLEVPDFEPAALDAALEPACAALRAKIEAEAARPPAADLAVLLGAADADPVGLSIDILSEGEVALFEALFGQMSGLTPPRLQRVLYEPSGLDLAVACRALDLDEADFNRLDGLLSQAPEARNGPKARPATGYGEIDRDAARGVLAYWRRDPAYLEAIERVREARETP